MKHEPSDKLACLQRHGLLTVVVGIISPEKRNSAVPDGEDAVIADRNPVSISAEVLKDTLRAIEGWLAIDDPLLMVKICLLKDLKALGSLRLPILPGNTRSPDSKLFSKRSRNLRLNNADMTLT